MEPADKLEIKSKIGWMPLTILRWALLAGAVLPCLYYLAATFCAWEFFRRRPEVATDFSPPLSILKPLMGLEPGAYENLASFCRQDYPDYEILLGVDDGRDPVIPIIEKLIRDFPALPIRMVVGAATIGSNNKVAKLCRLLPEARHELLVMSDSDVRVKPDYLRSVVSPLRDPSVGAVTCLYLGMTQPNLWSELEDLNLTSDFLPSALVARKLEGMNFALGATIAVTRSALAEIGGFEALADSAADDHELGRRIAAAGYRVELTPYAVETLCSSGGARDFFSHHLRWGVVIRHSRPWGYAGMLITQGLTWSMAAAALAPSRLAAIGYLSIPLAARLAMAFTFGARGLKDPLLRRRWWLIPFRDALGFFIWVASLFANRVSWRESKFYVRQGRLIPVATPLAPRHSRASGNPPRGNAEPAPEISAQTPHPLTPFPSSLSRGEREEGEGS
jgi:ceramide glucosyltransferase